MGATAAVHPSDQTLQSYGLGKLDDASAESVNRHLDSCSDCQRRVAELSSDSFLGRLQDAQGNADPPAPQCRRSPGCRWWISVQAHRLHRRVAPFRLGSPITPTTRCFASWARAEWGPSTWRAIGSWAVSRY